MPHPAVLLAMACALAVVGLVVAELRHWHAIRVMCKVSASTLMIFVATSLRAWDSRYGQFVLLALMLSWLGDVCLLSERSKWFLSGLAFFLLAHVAYSVAFATAEVHSLGFTVALMCMSAIGALTLRWLWRHLGKFDRTAVSAYVLAIVAMCSFAIARSTATHSWPVALGALTFAASDLSVARDRFISPSALNRAWGLPLYYVSQLLLAWSVTQ